MLNWIGKGFDVNLCTICFGKLLHFPNLNRKVKDDATPTPPDRTGEKRPIKWPKRNCLGSEIRRTAALGDVEKSLGKAARGKLNKNIDV